MEKLNDVNVHVSFRRSKKKTQAFALLLDLDL